MEEQHEKALKAASQHGVPAALFPLDAPWRLFPWCAAEPSPLTRLGAPSLPCGFFLPLRLLPCYLLRPLECRKIREESTIEIASEGH